MPESILRFKQLNYVSLALAAISAAFKPDLPLLLALIGFLIAIGVVALFIWLIAGKRKNWACWVFIVFAFGGLFTTLPDWWTGWDGRRISFIFDVLAQFAFIASAVVLFRSDAREWFRPANPTT